jgi:hypothetical protein
MRLKTRNVVRELGFNMHRNKAGKAERKKTQGDLAAILGIMP